jgi:hypothetical protein
LSAKLGDLPGETYSTALPTTPGSTADDTAQVEFISEISPHVSNRVRSPLACALLPVCPSHFIVIRPPLESSDFFSFLLVTPLLSAINSHHSDAAPH